MTTAFQQVFSPCLLLLLLLLSRAGSFAEEGVASPREEARPALDEDSSSPAAPIAPGGSSSGGLSPGVPIAFPGLLDAGAGAPPGLLMDGLPLAASGPPPGSEPGSSSEAPRPAPVLDGSLPGLPEIVLGGPTFSGPRLGLPIGLPVFLGAGADAPPPPAPGGAAGPGSRLGRFSVRPGMGFTAGPTTFLMAVGLDYFVTENLSAGVLGQIGVSDDHFLAAPTLGVQWTFDLPYPGLERLKPLAQGGLGFAYLERDRPGENPDEIGFLMNFGFGVDYYLTDAMAIGSTMLFNFLPDETLGDHFFFSWQVVAARFLF